MTDIRVMNPKARTHDRVALAEAMAESRRRILAGCTEPGNAPAGAPYPYQPHVLLPVLTDAGVRALVENR